MNNEQRKQTPVWSGVFRYFPRTIKAIASVPVDHDTTVADELLDGVPSPVILAAIAITELQLWITGYEAKPSTSEAWLCNHREALIALAGCSWQGNEQHNSGEPLHWARDKSRDHLDSLTRHFLDGAETDDDDIGHPTKVAWRALAHSEEWMESLPELPEDEDEAPDTDSVTIDIPVTRETAGGAS